MRLTIKLHFGSKDGVSWIDSPILDGDLPSTVVHTDLIQNFTKQKTFSDVGTSIVVTNRVNFNGDVQLGNSSLDSIFMNGTVDTDMKFNFGFTVNYNANKSSATSGVASALPSTPDSYVEIKVNGVKKYLPAYNA